MNFTKTMTLLHKRGLNATDITKVLGVSLLEISRPPENEK